MSLFASPPPRKDSDSNTAAVRPQQKVSTSDTLERGRRGRIKRLQLTSASAAAKPTPPPRPRREVEIYCRCGSLHWKPASSTPSRRYATPATARNGFDALQMPLVTQLRRRYKPEIPRHSYCVIYDIPRLYSDSSPLLKHVSHHRYTACVTWKVCENISFFSVKN